MEKYRKYILALRKCAIEHDNDRTSFGHIVVSDLCRDTTNLLKKLEQESVLDKVRADIKALEEGITSYRDDRPWVFKDEILEIIDKYMPESEKEE